jgi:hypothetical protein
VTRFGSSRVAIWTVAPVSYAALTVVLTWPLVLHLSTTIPHDLGDPVLNTWILWWNAHAVPFTARWWNPPSFWPTPGILAFSENLLGLAPLTSPVQWLGGSPVVAYNIAFLVSFPLSAIAAHALVYSLTGRHDASVLAAVIFGFGPYRVAHFPHLQLLTAYWMPLALLMLHRFVQTKDSRWLWFFGLAWLMQALSNGYYLLFFPLLLTLWLFWFVPIRSQPRLFAAAVGAWLIASLPLVPLLWGYWNIHSLFHLQRGIGDAEYFGADLASLLDASPMLKFSKLAVFEKAEGELFPGIIGPLLVGIVFVQWLLTASSADLSEAVDRRTLDTHRAGRDRRTLLARLSLALLAVSAVFVAVASSASLVGPWSLAVGQRTLLTVTVVYKPLSIAALFMLAAGLTHPRFIGLWQRRSLLGFYGFGMFVMYLLSFGPSPKLMGRPFLYKAPYAWLSPLPGFHSIRVPARFAMLGVMCLSVSAALALTRLTAKMSPGRRTLIACVAVGIALMEGWVGEMPLAHLPARLQTIESHPERSSVIELPLGEVLEDTTALYRGMYHLKPVVNGYSGFFPAYYRILEFGLEEGLGEDEIFDAFTEPGPAIFVIDTTHPSAARWTNVLSQRRGTVSLGVEDTKRLFWVPPIDRHDTSTDVRHADQPAGSRLSIQRISANAGQTMTRYMMDGDVETRWTSDAPQSGSEAIVIDLGSERVVSAISMGLGSHLTDFPRVLEIDRSENGQSWSTSWKGPTTAQAIAGATRNPKDVPIVVSIPLAPARFIRLRQVGQHPFYYWSITELAVYGQ